MKSFLYICIILIPILSSNAQELTIHEVYKDLRGPVLKDSKDRLWFVGPEKVTYYNGTWNDQKLPATAAYNSNVTSIREPLLLKEDKAGNIWTHSKNGILQYDGNSWKLHDSGKMNFSNTTMIFIDYLNRVYFLTINNEVGIYDNGNWTFLSKDLPKNINTFTDGDNEVLFGNNEKPKEVGVYNGSYKLVKDGDELKLFNLLNENAIVLDYSKQKNLSTYIQVLLTKDADVIKSDITDQGVVLIYPDKVLINSGENKREVQLANNVRKIISKKENISTITTYQEKLYIGLSEGLLEITGTNAKLLNTDDGLASENIVLLRTDPNENLIALHKKTATVAINGEWLKYDKSNGFDFDFKGYHSINITEWDKKLVLSNYLAPIAKAGKANVCIFEDGKWTTYMGNISYEKPALTNDGTLLFGGLKGGRLDGICYLRDGEFHNLTTDDGIPAKLTDLIYAENDIVWVTSISMLNQSFVTKLSFTSVSTK